jgi:hypothetical protein
MMNYDSVLFRDILDSFPLIRFIRIESRDGVSVAIYQNIHGRSVLIDVSEETIDDDLGIIYLKQLGLEDQIKSLYPKTESRP